MSGFWPHQFTKVGEPEKIGEETVIGDNTPTPVFAQRMHCVHCGLEYVRNKDSIPQGACPARNDKREAKRLGVNVKDVQ